jgi:hypothetical protein
MTDFTDLTRDLCDLMKASAHGMIPVQEGAGGLIMHAPVANPLKPEQPMWFGAVRAGKAYVSYHLMPVYSSPALAARISPALKKRMQGKSCFNFTKPDPDLFAELADLTAAGAEVFSKPLVMPERPPRR